LLAAAWLLLAANGSTYVLPFASCLLLAMLPSPLL